MEYGYVRASTNSDKQDIGRQKRELVAIGIKEHNIFGNMNLVPMRTGRSYNSFLKQ